MYNLVNSKYSRTYNPIGSQNALGDIKRLLTSRDTVGQTKACGYIIEVVKKYTVNSNDKIRMIEYLLENDIVVFLCEATSNLSYPLFRLVLECIRSLWCDRRFFVEEHATHAMSAVLRSLAHYSSTNMTAAVDSCLHFLCDLLNGISSFETTPVLSHQSPYCVEQLLACFDNLASRISGNTKAILSSALVINELIAYQPNNLDLRANIATKLFEVLSHWFSLLIGGMNHQILVDDNEEFGIFLVIISQLGINILRLIKALEKEKPPSDFIETILSDDQELQMLKKCLSEIKTTTSRVINELVVLVKDNQDKIKTEEYSVFLKFLLLFLTENSKTEAVANFCDVLLINGYLTVLPQYQVIRNDNSIRRLSTLTLVELLKALALKYLIVDCQDGEACAADIHLGLVELQIGIETPEDLGPQLLRAQPHSLIIYVYFYCQSSDKPEQITAPLLPYLVELVSSISGSSQPPSYITKALWLVFAMAAVSNHSLSSLDERLSVERAAARLIALLGPDAVELYTHHPAILLWTFTTMRIPNSLRLNVLSQWLKIENTLPEGLTEMPIVWELLLDVLVHGLDESTVSNCMDALNYCIENADDNTVQDFSNLAWSILPGILSSALIDSENAINSNICYVLEIATSQPPATLAPEDCVKVAVLIATLFTKTSPESMELEAMYRYEYASLKLCLMLLRKCYEQSNNTVLLTFVNRLGFLPRVLAATDSAYDDVACAACDLLSYTVLCFTKNKYQPTALLEIKSDVVIKSLRRDGSSERGASLLHFIYTVLSSANTPLVITTTIELQPSAAEQCNALQALLFRVQLMLCCENMETQSPMGWKALNSIFKHAIVYKNDPKLVATLSTQPWTFLLIRFQMAQNMKKDFAFFLYNWLTLLKITIAKCKDEKSIYISRHSIIRRTLIMIKRHVNEESDDSTKVLAIANEILNDYCNNKE